MVDGTTLVQVDSDYSNMVEVAKGAAAIHSQVDYSGGGDYANVVFVRPPNGVIIAAFGPAPGGQPGQGVWPAGEYFLTTSPNLAPGVAKYVVYAHSVPARTSPSNGVGLLIKDPSGRPRYYSGWNYVKVVANLIAPQSAPTYEFDLPQPQPGTEYYVCLNNLWLTQSVAPDSEYGYFAEFLTNNRIRIYTQLFAGESPGTVSTNSPPAWHTPSIMIAEVLI